MQEKMHMTISKGARHGGPSSIIVTGIDNSAKTQSQVIELVKKKIKPEMVDERVLVTQIEGGVEIRYAAKPEQIKYLEEGLKNQMQEKK